MCQVPNKARLDCCIIDIPQGFFTSDISTNSTWTLTSRNTQSSEHEVWTQPFCRMIERIDQDPDLHKEQECPPKQGWALMVMEGWVMEMFIVPVSDALDLVLQMPL